MKKILILTMLVMAGVLGVNAQSTQTANEGYVGYSFLRQDVKFERPNFRFDENTDSHGFVGSYTRYLGNNTATSSVGLTAEVGANFDNNKANLVTALGGLTIKARSQKYVQPFVKVLGGVARQSVERRNISDFSETKFAYSLGGGLDFNLKSNSRYKLRVGADYVATRFYGQRQDAVRLNTGLVF